MSSKVSKGIALLLFGILLCAGSGEINTTILYNFGDFPFAAIGVIVVSQFINKISVRIIFIGQLNILLCIWQISHCKIIFGIRYI